MIFPEGKKFAFTIFDDTDGATVKNVSPIYDLLKKLGIFTTKSVWVFSSKNFNNSFSQTETLEDRSYLDFILSLKKNGFEIALHGVSSNSNVREKTILGINKFNKLLECYPTSYAVHLNNQDNLYWDKDRFNSSLLKMLMSIYKQQKDNYFQGHLKNSPFFWGDICRKYNIRYVRNFTFKEINLLKINPTLPYHDPKKPMVPFWFSSSDGADVEKFNRLLLSQNQERLEREGGVCIVYTHLAFGFTKQNKVHPKTKRLLEELANRQGWFVPVTQLLDYLRKQREDSIISKIELKKIEYRWTMEKILAKILKINKLSVCSRKIK